MPDSSVGFCTHGLLCPYSPQGYLHHVNTSKREQSQLFHCRLVWCILELAIIGTTNGLFFHTWLSADSGLRDPLTQLQQVAAFSWLSSSPLCGHSTVDTAICFSLMDNGKPAVSSFEFWIKLLWTFFQSHFCGNMFPCLLSKYVVAVWLVFGWCV